MGDTHTPTSPDTGGVGAQTKEPSDSNTNHGLGGGSDHISAKIDKLVGFLAPWFNSSSSSRLGGKS